MQIVGKAQIEKTSAKNMWGAKERQGGTPPPFSPRSRTPYFHVPFLMFTPSQISESLEQATECLFKLLQLKVTDLLSVDMIIWH